MSEETTNVPQETPPETTSETPQQEATPEETGLPEEPDMEKEILGLLGDDLGDEDLGIGETPASPSGEAPAPTTETEAPEEETQAPEEKVEEKAAEPSGEDQPSQQEAQTTAATVEQSAEELAKALETYKAQAIERLANEVYKLTPEEAQALEEDPGEALKTMVPKALSRVHIEAQQAAMMQIARILPELVQHVTQQQQQAQTFEQKFFERWPQLKDHRQEVLKIGQAYRQFNPSASPEDFIEQVGVMAAASLKLPLQEEPPTPQPFQPVASRAGVSKPAPTPKPSNIFEELAMMDDEDEE